MTRREQQILAWITENPLISQRELAEKAGITRSSVAVHISNLMKKGCISGKGYIVRTAPYVTVTGGVNVDIGGKPGAPLVSGDSNPGTVHSSLGGVGRNIAHNLALLGLDVRLVTAFGDDLNAKKISDSCAELGVDISQSPVISGGRTSTYLFINDEKGDMALAVSDMEIYSHLTPEVLEKRLKLFNGSGAVVLDANLPEESIRYLAENCTAPLFADPVSTAKAGKFRDVLGVIVSLGKDGVFALDRDGNCCRMNCLPGKAVNATGCGDAFMAAAVWAFLREAGLEDTIKAGLAASAITMEAAETNSPVLNEETLMERAEIEA